MKKNRLAGETSPYLQQHADNPVNWFPWCDEALRKAQREDKPILLSIGYSACHWCHVMAHESFEDPNTAAIMNELFVNIKVDREERPDLDKIYQFAHQLLTRRPGGWPLNMFLTPDRYIPFFGGTYFPDRPAYNMPPFKQVLRDVADFYHRRKADLARHAVNFENTLNALSAPTAPQPAEATVLDDARREIESLFDWEHGGIGGAPKFPHTTALEFLLRRWNASGGDDARGLEMVRQSLEMMARGGIYDQLGGGFCRYSVDVRWHIPHFEKMLYDNGLLLALYSQAWQATGEELFKKTATETANWVMEEMQSPEGGYFSSLDADSEGKEGEYYVWDKDEVQSLLDEDEFRIVEKHFGLDGPANFEGRWHLFAALPPADAGAALGFDPDHASAILESARTKLLKARAERVRPGRDEKILTAWNALMIRGMAMAGRILQEQAFIDSARRAMGFLHATLWKKRLLATHKDGRSHLNAYLDDYAFLIDAGIELLQAHWDTDTLHWLCALSDHLLAHFQDTDHGGFFFTADDHETLLQRPKPFGDDATPSGNAVAALALSRLGRLVGDTRYEEAARRCIDAATADITRVPHAHSAYLCGLDEILSTHDTVVVRGKNARAWQKAVLAPYAPRRLCFVLPDDSGALPGVLAERTFDSGETTAFLCTGTACLPPISSLEVLRAALSTT